MTIWLADKAPGACLAITIALDLAFAQRVHGKALLHALPVCAEFTVTGGLLDAIGSWNVLREAPGLCQPLAQCPFQPQLLMVCGELR